MSMILPGDVDLEGIKRWLDSVLWEKEKAGDMDIFRMKGILSVAESPRRHLLQVRVEEGGGTAS